MSSDRFVSKERFWKEVERGAEVWLEGSACAEACVDEGVEAIGPRAGRMVML